MTTGGATRTVAARGLSRISRHDVDHHGRFDLTARTIHFIGIAGCGMSGLARIARQAGATCTGSDVEAGAAVDMLRADGIAVELEQHRGIVPDGCDLVVVSAAIGADHPEVVEARQRGVAVLKYAELLGHLMRGRTGVAVAGTHGKSTTTSLLSHMLIVAEKDPSFIVGAHCRQIGGGSRVGQSGDLLIAEACEFDRSFHNLHPKHAVILNVEEDHLDIYRNLDEIVESFTHFAKLVPADGSLLIQHELPHRLAITAGLACRVETIGFSPQADWRIEVAPRPPKAQGDGTRVALHHRGACVATWENQMPGEHMAYNAAVAAVTAHRAGAPWARIASAASSFEGLDRRMQPLGVRCVSSTGALVSVVDDYGHHPTEIDTTLRALRSHYAPNRLICVFQPHQHSRTRFLMEQFAVSFSHADIVIVPHIYFVRDSEKERHAVRSADLVDRLRQRGSSAMHLYPFGAIVEQLDLIVRDGDLLVTMGAGDVWEIAHEFLRDR